MITQSMIFLYLLPGCTETIIMIIFTVGFVIYHRKIKSSVSSGRSSPDESGECYELQSIPSITKVSCIALTSNSKVWLGRDKSGLSGQELVVVKSINDITIWKREMLINRDLCHENILRFLKDYKYELDHCLVFEYHHHGNLRTFLKTFSPTEFNVLLDMTISLSHGLNYLHNNVFIAHRDIKSYNVLVKSNGMLCLCDFGMAVRLVGDNGVDLIPQNKFSGTKRYLSPEILREQMNFEMFTDYMMSDIYSFSYVLWELFNCTTGHYSLPFEGQLSSDPSITAVRMLVCDRKCRPIIPSTWYDTELFCSIVKILEQSWNDIPTKRMTILSILNELQKIK